MQEDYSVDCTKQRRRPGEEGRQAKPAVVVGSTGEQD